MNVIQVSLETVLIRRCDVEIVLHYFGLPELCVVVLNSCLGYEERGRSVVVHTTPYFTTGSIVVTCWNVDGTCSNATEPYRAH